MSDKKDFNEFVEMLEKQIAEWEKEEIRKMQEELEQQMKRLFHKEISEATAEEIYLTIMLVLRNDAGLQVSIRAQFQAFLNSQKEDEENKINAYQIDILKFLLMLGGIDSIVEKALNNLGVEEEIL